MDGSQHYRFYTFAICTTRQSLARALVCIVKSSRCSSQSFHRQSATPTQRTKCGRRQEGNKRTTALPIVQPFLLFDPLFQSTTSLLFGCILFCRPSKPSFLDSFPLFVFHLRAKWQQVRIVTFCVHKRSLVLPCPLERTGTQLLLCCCFRLEPAETILADFTPFYVSCFL
jgi:hypothetical protein